MKTLTNSVANFLQIELTYACNLNCPFCYN